MNDEGYAKDCLHLAACRRCSKLAKNVLKYFSRKCDKETCTCYEPYNSRLYSYDDVKKVVYELASDMQYNTGYGPGDYIVTDFIEDRRK